jgi:tRNA pseudouridine55 synthase
LIGLSGSQLQIVPAFSAVKIKGKKLYDRVLHEPDFDLSSLPSKKVEITELTLEDWQINPKAKTLSGSLRIACSSGTYVRSIVHDLGLKLGVGACVMELRRLSIGPWSANQAAKISDENIKLYQDISQLPQAH